MTKAVIAATLLIVFMATDGAEARKKWEFPVSPYFWLQSWSGSVGTGDTRPIDLSVSDYLDKLSWGASAHAEALYDPWALMFDIVYRNLKPEEGDFLADIDLLQVELAAAYEVGLWVPTGLTFEALAGGRYYGTSVLLKDMGIEVGDRDKQWVDPIIGGRVVRPFKEAWTAVLRGDIGGFGVGSTFSWNLVLGVGYRVGTMSFFAAWRTMGVDYEDGSGADKFVWDTVSTGPGIGLTFHL